MSPILIILQETLFGQLAPEYMRKTVEQIEKSSFYSHHPLLIVDWVDFDQLQYCNDRYLINSSWTN